MPRCLLLRTFLLALLSASALWAQDTRTVTEPVIPKPCATLFSTLQMRSGRLSEADEAKPDTKRIQDAIDHCNGGAVELRADGKNEAFLTGPLELKQHVVLWVTAHTVVFASRDARDYDVRTTSCGLVNDDGRGCKPLIHVKGAHDCGVMGDGIIDGRGGEHIKSMSVSWWDLARTAQVQDKRQNVPRLIVAEEADGFTLYRITLRNSPNFHVLVSKTDGFTAWGVKIDSPKTSRNTDGIDPASSTNVSILYSNIRVGDDNVAIKAGSTGPSTHMTIAHNHFYSGHGMSIGSETNGGASDIAISDLTIDGADNGLRIKSDVSRGGLVQRVSYDHVCIRDTKNPILMDPFYSDHQGSLVPWFKDIVLTDVNITSPGKITLRGHDAEHRLGITLDRVVVPAMEPVMFDTSHARISVKGGSHTPDFKGQDVEVSNTQSEMSANDCSAALVPFPENAEVSQPASSQQVQPSPGKTKTEITVAADGSGDIPSIQAAVNALSESGGTIRIKPGSYREVVKITKPDVHIFGAGKSPEDVVIVYDNSNGKAGGTYRSASVFIEGDGFFATNLTFANDFSKKNELTPQGSQAVAVAVSADRAIFHNVHFIGAQDTLYARSRSCAGEQGPCVIARQYFSDCYIEGHVDFIFGDAKAYFDHCYIHAIANKTVMLTAQSKRYADQDSAYVFDHCHVTADAGAQNIILGRPWRPYSTVIYMDTILDAPILAEGWHEWRPGETQSLDTSFYAEYDSQGPGANAQARDLHSHTLTKEQAEKFRLKDFYASGETRSWDPKEELKKILKTK